MVFTPCAGAIKRLRQRPSYLRRLILPQYGVLSSPHTYNSGGSPSRTWYRVYRSTVGFSICRITRTRALCPTIQLRQYAPTSSVYFEPLLRQIVWVIMENKSSSGRVHPGGDHSTQLGNACSGQRQSFGIVLDQSMCLCGDPMLAVGFSHLVGRVHGPRALISPLHSITRQRVGGTLSSLRLQIHLP